MTLRKITDRDLQGYGVIGMADTPNLSAREMQEKVEEVVRSVVIPVMNENIDNTVSKQDLAEVVLNAGAGDMLTLIYDSNRDGIVNKADNGFFPYTHSKTGNVHYLTGTGDNIKFIATADYEDGDVFMIDGNNCSPFLSSGDTLPSGHFKAGYVVSCFRNGDCLNFNGGGVALNFQVVGGITKPASPKENTIWVNTRVEITSWALDGNEPDYLPEGGVWIEIGTSGSTLFNALKKNALRIAPKQAWQWIGGNFVEKDMLAYMDGEWKKVEQVLFPYGLAFETGGTNADKGDAEATYLHCEATETHTYGNCYSVNTIDSRNYTKLIFIVESVTLAGNATATVGAHPTGPGSTSGGYIAYKDVTAPGTYEVDLSEADGELYVTVSVWTSDAEAEMTVTGVIAV